MISFDSALSKLDWLFQLLFCNWRWLFWGCIFMLGRLLSLLEICKLAICLGSLKFVPHPMLFQSMLCIIWLYPFIFQSISWTKLADPETEFLPCNELLEHGTLKKGDILEFERTVFRSLSNFAVFQRMYSHWGIYDGHGFVYHFVTHSDGTPASVEYDEITKAAIGQRCRVNNLEKIAEFNKVDRKNQADIITNARTAYRTKRSSAFPSKYNLIKYNCEHFVTECVFGTPFSIFADKANNLYAEKYSRCHWKLFIVYMGVYYLYKVDSVRIFINEQIKGQFALNVWNSSLTVFLRKVFSIVMHLMEFHETLFLVIIGCTSAPIIYAYIVYYDL